MTTRNYADMPRDELIAWAKKLDAGLSHCVKIAEFGIRTGNNVENGAAIPVMGLAATATIPYYHILIDGKSVLKDGVIPS